MNNRIPWGRVLLEGAVIVFSILLAFAIDAWWAEVGERKEEQLALVRLSTDFEGYLLELAHIRERNEKRVESTRALMNLAGPRPENANGEIVQDHLGRVIVYRSIILPAGTLSSLLETDGLALISDSTLRYELLAWTQILEAAQERNAYLIEQSRELDAFLKPRYPMAKILRQSQVTVHNLSIDDPMNEASFPVDVTELLSDQEFANHMAFAEDASLLVIQSVDRLVDKAQRILSLIRK